MKKNLSRRRPQRKLFTILLAVYFVWMGGLLVMYFKTVRPERFAPPDDSN